MFCGPWEKRNMSTLGDAKPNAKIYIPYPYYLYIIYINVQTCISRQDHRMKFRVMSIEPVVVVKF